MNDIGKLATALYIGGALAIGTAVGVPIVKHAIESHEKHYTPVSWHYYRVKHGDKLWFVVDKISFRDDQQRQDYDKRTIIDMIEEKGDDGKYRKVEDTNKIKAGRVYRIPVFFRRIHEKSNITQLEDNNQNVSYLGTLIDKVA